MDISALLARFSAESPLVITRGGPATAARLACEAARAGRRVALVVRSREELTLMRGLVTLFSPEMSVGRPDVPAPGAGTAPEGPLWERTWIALPSFNHRSLSRDGWSARMAALYALRHGTSRGIIMTADNLLPFLPPVDFFAGREIVIRRNEELSPDLVLEQLAEWGYRRESMVSRAGDMARRGDILDVLPPGYDRPVRIEFFGDTVDEMRIFDPHTQRSVGGIDEVTLLPVSPLRQDVPGRKAMRGHWARLFQRGVMSEFAEASMTRALEQGDMRLMPGCAYDSPASLENWTGDALWLLPGARELEESLRRAELQWGEDILKDAEETRLEQPEHLTARRADDAARALETFPRAHMEPLLMGTETKGVELPERACHSFSELFPGRPDPDRPWQQLVAGLRNWLGEKRQVLLAFASERGRRKFLKLAEQDGLYPALRYDPAGRGLFALVAPFQQGAELVWDSCLVLGEEILQPRARRGRSSAAGAFRGLNSYDELKPGDLLVHRDYGIGRFGGLHRMNLGGVDNDYLLLEYADDAKLYLPVDRLSVVQRFKASGDGPEPAVDRLGGTAWTSSREKARRAVEKIAADLVEMYAWRKVAKGFSYSPLGEMYREFEASFGFEETPDQARAIQEVLADMEKTVPMDRLVCGDVGFGKTEVALRAAFRAACDGRQVALLCPTTVLAEQHYQTFRARLAGFPVNVGLLSRFVPRARQQETLRAAEKGQIDILIGTHRLLSQDVILPNLGLLILDEEQRFGVRHKEKLKQLRKNVDALTLTATPIPRTLQLSMSGIRELSVIETAPAERKPVASMLMNRDAAALRQIVEREIAREGQVFWVHNRVQQMERTVAFVRDLVPQARIGMAHGQMGEKELEDAMHRFWHGELDVLVCTAIVESGLDFPRANTLIVDQAQMFGLGQLYQLRGRVGRSDRQAYAVFVVPDIDNMPEQVRERMRVIMEMDYLGAGFQVAMEDLRLRGAGNILGEAQSGHMARVGIELYLEMLEDAVTRLKGEGETLRTETEMNLGLPAHIPDTYIGDGRERLKYYKMLSSAPDGSARQEVVMELRDRFGPLPEELETFVSVLAFKWQVNRLGIARADLFPDRIRVTWADGQSCVRPEALVRLITAHAERARLFPPASMELRLDVSLSLPLRLDDARSLLASLLPSGAASAEAASDGEKSVEQGGEQPARLERPCAGNHSKYKETGT